MTVASDSEFSVLYTTLPHREAGLDLARQVVNEQLAGCVNIIDGVTSVYRWEGTVQTDAEVVLLLKTRTSLVPALMQRVIELHPYDTPGVSVWPVADIAPGYADWLRQVTSESPRV
ncbi:MAG: divalent-cation tolerance protein CutA [Planctomycetaceae bacterium]